MALRVAVTADSARLKAWRYTTPHVRKLEKLRDAGRVPRPGQRCTVASWLTYWTVIRNPGKRKADPARRARSVPDMGVCSGTRRLLTGNRGWRLTCAPVAAASPARRRRAPTQVLDLPRAPLRRPHDLHCRRARLRPYRPHIRHQPTLRPAVSAQVQLPRTANQQFTALRRRQLPNPVLSQGQPRPDYLAFPRTRADPGSAAGDRQRACRTRRATAGHRKHSRTCGNRLASRPAGPRQLTGMPHH
jgi:hypothetical protein